MRSLGQELQLLWSLSRGSDYGDEMVEVHLKVYWDESWFGWCTNPRQVGAYPQSRVSWRVSWRVTTRYEEWGSGGYQNGRKGMAWWPDCSLPRTKSSSVAIARGCESVVVWSCKNNTTFPHNKNKNGKDDKIHTRLRPRLSKKIQVDNVKSNQWWINAKSRSKKLWPTWSLSRVSWLRNMTTTRRGGSELT